MSSNPLFKTQIQIQIVSADPMGILLRLTAHNIILENVISVDPVTIHCTVNKNQYRNIKKVLKTCAESVRVIDRSGWYWTFRKLRNRPVLFIAMVTLLILSIYLPTRVLFVSVVGNESIPTNYIIAKAESCGISFGASRRHVRSEKVKNALLQAVPQLQWAGVNTSGCTATVTVKERNETQSSETSKVGNIIAIMDGLVVDCTVEKGNQLCKVGQAVTEGQVLVSGYSDNGLSILATKPKAEIYGLTNRKATLVSPAKYQSRENILRTERRFSIQVGKNIINFNNSSGISDTTCVKIYDKRELKLPGGFVLPVTLIRETRHYYTVCEKTSDDVDSFRWTKEHMHDLLLQQMIAGKILSEDHFSKLTDDLYQMEADYVCIEMIGKYKQEEIFQ